MATTTKASRNRPGLPVVFSWDRFFRQLETTPERNRQTLEAGSTVAGRFQIQSFWKESESCRLFIAFDGIERSKVILKFLTKAHDADLQMQAKFYRCGKLLWKYRPRGMASVLAAGWYGNLAFLVIEPVNGQPFEEHISKRFEKDDDFLEAEVKEIIRQLCAIYSSVVATEYGVEFNTGEMAITKDYELCLIGGFTRLLIESNDEDAPSESERVEEYMRKIAGVAYWMLCETKPQDDAPAPHILDPCISFGLSNAIDVGRDGGHPNLSEFAKQASKNGFPAWGRLLALVVLFALVIGAVVTASIM